MWSSSSAAGYVKKNKWLLLMLLAGLLLLLLPGRREESGSENAAGTAEEQRLAGALRRTEGVGEVYVLLAKGSGRNDGFTGAVVVCAGAGDPRIELQIVQEVMAFTGLGSDRIVVQKYDINSIGGRS